jgi:UDP-GlcNAc:undecaprenyl-phosphate GlcNAc-1-phosphate transferase
VAAALAVSLGARITTLHNVSAPPWITIPFSLVWLIGCANAVNLIDGMDGLASGVGLFATLATLGAALMSGNGGLAMATVPLAACLLAFLRYNFSPASIFLGDCGSLTIGFMLGCFGLIWSHHGGTLVGMTLPMVALALPLLDVVLAISRRAIRRVPIFKGDRGHIHHMVLARGFKPHMAALILYSFCAVAAAFALLQTFLGLRYRGPILLIFGCVIWSGIQYLGYVELRAVSRIFSRKRLLEQVREDIYLQELEMAFEGAQSTEQFWSVIESACDQMRFASVQMYLNGTVYSAAYEIEAVEPVWTLTVGLGKYGQLVLTRAEQSRPAALLAFLVQLQNAAREVETKFRLSTTYHDAA